MNPERTNITVGTPKRGDSPYGTNEYAKAPALDTKNTGGVVGKPYVGGDYVPVPNKSAPTNNPGTTLNTTYNHENLSAKYKYPRVSQDVPVKGKGQFEAQS